MTGYGRARAPFGRGTVVVEARSVNHRFLDVRLRLAPAVADYASAIDSTARRLLRRGRVEISAKLEGSPSELQLDTERARSAMVALDALRQELRPDEPVPLSLLAVVPQLFRETDAADADALWSQAEQATTQSCRQLQTMQQREGQALALDLGTRIGRVKELAAALRPLSEGVVLEHRHRLRARIQKLLEGVSAPTDPQRLEQEVALFADRSDICEELTRLDSHCNQFAELIGDGGDEPVGRKLEFLLQELGREVNTVGSKSSDLGITRQVVELKAELERIREQVQNVQ